MAANDILRRAKLRLSGVVVSDELLEELISQCIERALSITWRSELPGGMEGMIAKWAVAEYNALGIEGETSHSEGGVSRSIDAIPKDIQAELKAWRRAGAGLNAIART